MRKTHARKAIAGTAIVLGLLWGVGLGIYSIIGDFFAEETELSVISVAILTLALVAPGLSYAGLGILFFRKMNVAVLKCLTAFPALLLFFVSFGVYLASQPDASSFGIHIGLALVILYVFFQFAWLILVSILLRYFEEERWRMREQMRWPMLLFASLVFTIFIYSVCWEYLPEAQNSKQHFERYFGEFALVLSISLGGLLFIIMRSLVLPDRLDSQLLNE